MGLRQETASHPDCAFPVPTARLRRPELQISTPAHPKHPGWHVKMRFRGTRRVQVVQRGSVLRRGRVPGLRCLLQAGSRARCDSLRHLGGRYRAQPLPAPSGANKKPFPRGIEHRVGIQSAQMAISTLWIRILILFFRECGASSTGPKLSLAPPLVLRLLHLLLLLLVLLLFLLSSFLWSSCPSLLVPLHAPVLVLPLCHRLRHSVGKFSTSTLTVVPLFRHGHAGEMLRARDADLLQRL